MQARKPEVEIVLCVPGPWADINELKRRMSKANSGYIFSDLILMNIETQETFELQFEDRDERMKDAFHAAGPHWKDTPEMGQIDSHNSVVYLISEGGDIKTAHAIMEAANSILKAGGYAVKVESTGLAHPPSDWNDQCAYNYLFKSHASYVVYIDSEQVYSCGMHNFGLPDAIVDYSDAENPPELLKSFTFYLLSESPEIRSGQTFSVASDAPVYRILEHPSVNYGEDSLFNNPFGTWKLQLC